MQKIAILSCVNIRHMSLISLYTDILNKKGIGYDIIYMDKYDEIEIFPCRKRYRYINIINRNWPRVYKAFRYLLFRTYAERVLEKEKYDFIIVWNDVAIFMFANYLSKHCQGKYCLNVRDNMYYDNVCFKKMYSKCFSKSAFNTISSKGYLSFLPKESKYIEIYSLNLSALSNCHCHKQMRSASEPIRIGFIGYVRYFERNKQLLDWFANDSRFELAYYGAGAEKLQKYARDNEIHNVSFYGAFDVTETSRFLEEIDIMNNLYGNDTVNVRTAISIKFFHAIYAKIPILVDTSTYIGKLADELGIGYYVTKEGMNLVNDIYHWYRTLKFENIEKSSKIVLDDVIKANKAFESTVINEICK